MRLTKIACSHCSAVLKSRVGVRVGKKLVCPSCCEPFAATAPEAARKSQVLRENGKERFAARRSTRRSTQRIARPADIYRVTDEPEELAEWQDDLEVPPRRRKGKKPRLQATSSLALTMLLLMVVAIVSLAAVGFVAHVVLRKFQGGETPPIVSQPSNNSVASVSPVTDIPAGWKEFTSVKGRFRAMMPQTVLERTRRMESIVGPVRDTQYLRETNGKNLGYSISFGDFSRPQVSKSSLQMVIDAGRDAILKQYGGKLEADRNIERDGRLGREVIIFAPGSGRFILHYYIAGSRLYTLTVAGSTATRDSKEVHAFFDSFHFTEAKL